MKKAEPIKPVNTPVEPVKPRRKFDRNFKKEAVALWLNSGRSAREVAGELGISENRLYLWRKQFTPVTPWKVNCRPCAGRMPNCGSSGTF